MLLYGVLKYNLINTNLHFSLKNQLNFINTNYNLKQK